MKKHKNKQTKQNKQEKTTTTIREKDYPFNHTPYTRPVQNIPVGAMHYGKWVMSPRKKEPGPIAGDLKKNFQRFWYWKKACIFLTTTGEFYSLKVYCLEDVNENVTGYGNHRQLQYT